MTSRPSRSARTNRTRAADNSRAAQLRVQQTELFPEAPVIERLDPRSIVGPRTGVLVLTRVRIRSSDAPHLVFHDRHGWYCEEHGASCPSVPIAREADANAATIADTTADPSVVTTAVTTEAEPDVD